MDDSQLGRYVICRCQHCDGGIEFDANGFGEGESQTIACPHCGLETIILVPKSNVPPILETQSDQVNLTSSPHQVMTDDEKVRLRMIYELARGHFFGNGVKQDLVEAYKWLYIARGGFGEAISQDEDLELDNIRDFLAEKLTPAQIRDAHNRAELDQQGSDGLWQPTRQAIPSEVRREVWRRDGGAYVKCGSRRNLEYDHIVPVSEGGSNTTRNIELLCEGCNRAKSNSIQ